MSTARPVTRPAAAAARYAGADLAEAGRPGTAISTMLVATTLGAVGGPLLVPAPAATSRAASFLVAAVAYGLATAVLSTWLRPDPMLTARSAVPAASPEASGSRTVPQAQAGTAAAMSTMKSSPVGSGT